MKIDGIKTGSVQSKSGKKKTKESQDISFASLLTGQLSPVEEAPLVATTEEISRSSSVSSELRLTGVTLSENTIDTLAAFARALEDLSFSEEALTPLVDALEEGTIALLDIREQLDESDPLAALLDRVAAVTFLETEKYRRGDYKRG